MWHWWNWWRNCTGESNISCADLHSHFSRAWATPKPRLRDSVGHTAGDERLAVMDWALDVSDGTTVMGICYSRSLEHSVEGRVGKATHVDAADRRHGTELFRTMQLRLDAMAPMRPRPIARQISPGLVFSRLVDSFGRLRPPRHPGTL